MTRTTTSADEAAVPAPSGSSADDQRVRGNILVLLLHQTLFRVAWIFKTESVIMPAFLDTVADSGIARGALPLLNRVGQSLAPLMLAERLSAAPLKTRWLIRTTFLMGVPFLFLAACVALGHARLPPSFAAVFLPVYALFFCLHGINETTVSTVLGKLIPVTSRGRLQAAASLCGTLVAITLAAILLRRWLAVPGQAPFASIFAFVGSVMMLAGLSARRLIESPDAGAPLKPLSVRHPFQAAFRRLKDDWRLRRLCVIAVLFIFSQIIFPHYQRLGLSLAGASPRDLMTWVIAQHIGATCFSSVTGWLADRRGTRASLRLLTGCAAVSPLLALGLSQLNDAGWYWPVFAWIGLVPVTLKMLVNCALELTEREHHPACISTLNLCMAGPFLIAPLVGGCVQWFGFTAPFLVVSGVIAAGALLAWMMPEPRESLPSVPNADDGEVSGFDSRINGRRPG